MSFSFGVPPSGGILPKQIPPEGGTPNNHISNLRSPRAILLAEVILKVSHVAARRIVTLGNTRYLL